MTKIEKDKPLPRHTKLNYDECYAKVILEKFFPDEYRDLQISDRPDLRTVDRCVGIEVTSAIPQGEQEALALACEIPYDDAKTQNKKIAYLCQKGYKYTEGIMTHPPRSLHWEGFETPSIEKTFCIDFINAVEKKIDRLNKGNYTVLTRYDLFVHSELLIDEWMLPKLMDKLILLSARTNSYAFIYLHALNELFIFDLKSKTWRVIETGKNLWELGELARNIVEAGEHE